jgi:Uma2 family endonuclease
MATAATKLMTAEEFYEWANRPENRDKNCELERGEIVETNLNGRQHGMVCANAVGLLGNFTFARRKGYVCSNNAGVIVERNPDTVRGPDIMLFEDTKRLEDVDLKYGEQPPLLAVEVLSPNDTMGKVTRCVQEQLRFGTRLVWVLDPEARNVVVCRADKANRVVEEKEELTGEEILPDFRCKVAEFFVLPGE